MPKNTQSLKKKDKIKALVKCGRENRTLQPSPSLGRRSRVVVVLADPIRELVVLLPLQGIGVGVRAGDDGAAARVREAQVLHGLASGSCCDRTASGGRGERRG